jgi:hypothetical protein
MAEMEIFCSATVKKRLKTKGKRPADVLLRQCRRLPHENSTHPPLCLTHLNMYNADNSTVRIWVDLSNVGTADEDSPSEQDEDRGKVNTAAATESSQMELMVKMVADMQNSIAALQAGQAEPKLKVNRGSSNDRRRSKRNKKATEFLSEESGLSSSADDSSDLEEQVLVHDLRLAGLGAPELKAAADSPGNANPGAASAAPLAPAQAGTGNIGYGVGGRGSDRLQHDAIDAGQRSTPCLSPMAYPEGVLAQLVVRMEDQMLTVTPRALLRILEHSVPLRFVKGARPAEESSTLTVCESASGAKRLAHQQRRYRFLLHIELLDFLDAWQARKRRVAVSLSDHSAKESARQAMDELEQVVRSWCCTSGGMGFASSNVNRYLVVVEKIWKATNHLVVEDCKMVWELVPRLKAKLPTPPERFEMPSGPAAAGPLLVWPKEVKGRQCASCDHKGWSASECPVCHGDHPTARAALAAKRKGR